MGKGLKVRTVNGTEFEVCGKVEERYISDEGLIYYCGGQSWPAEIVTEILL